jgi:hypothetical protein
MSKHGSTVAGKKIGLTVKDDAGCRHRISTGAVNT